LQEFFGHVRTSRRIGKGGLGPGGANILGLPITFLGRKKARLFDGLTKKEFLRLIGSDSM